MGHFAHEIMLPFNCAAENSASFSTRKNQEPKRCAATHLVVQSIVLGLENKGDSDFQSPNNNHNHNHNSKIFPTIGEISNALEHFSTPQHKSNRSPKKYGIFLRISGEFLRRSWKVIALQRTMAGPSTWTFVLVVMILPALYCSYLVLLASPVLFVGLIWVGVIRT